MRLTDTHCHIHQSDYPLDTEEVIKAAHEKSIKRLICVGVDKQSSQEAIELAEKHSEVYASVGVHPHEAQCGTASIEALANKSQVVAIGECGLDYHYTHSPKKDQMKALEQQIAIAISHNLPLIFHVRDAFEDFWQIIDNFRNMQGVLHSFTGTTKDLEKGLARGFYFGINGISTFTKNSEQKAMFSAIPLEKIILETDAPFLTPSPFRGKKNQPAFTLYIAEHLANQRNIKLEELATITESNVDSLFSNMKKQR